MGENKIFEKLRQSSKGKENLFYMMALHMRMGISHGTALNKILKDIIIDSTR